jgi:hypothetical protein
MPVEVATLLLQLTIGCRFDSHPPLDRVFKEPIYRYGLLETATDSSSGAPTSNKIGVKTLSADEYPR